MFSFDAKEEELEEDTIMGRVTGSVRTYLTQSHNKIDINKFGSEVRNAFSDEAKRIRQQEAELRKKQRRKEQNRRRAERRVEQWKKNPHQMVTRSRLPDLKEKEKLTPSERISLIEMYGLNRCTKCNQNKEVECFYKRKIKTPNDCGLSKVCIECENDKYNNRSLLKDFNDLARSTRKRAEEKGLDHNITGEDLVEIYRLQRGRCNYTGKRMKVKTHRKHSKRLQRHDREERKKMVDDKNTYHNMDKISVDRIDSSKGYTRDNVHLIRVHVNFAKMDMDEDDFIQMCKDVVSLAALRDGPTAAPLMARASTLTRASLSESSDE